MDTTICIVFTSFTSFHPQPNPTQPQLQKFFHNFLNFNIIILVKFNLSFNKNSTLFLMFFQPRFNKNSTPF